MSPAKRQALQAAVDMVGERARAGVGAAAIIAELVEQHGAIYRPRWDANRLRCAAVSSSCTGSKDTGLLDNWKKTAGLRLIMANHP